MNFVYITTNLINKKQYVGSHNGEPNDNYLGSGKIINKAINKYERKNFKRKILKITETRKEAFDLEKPYIKKFNSLLPNGYNISPTGGMNEWGGKHSKETKKKLSEKRKGKDPWNKGKKGVQQHSQKTKDKLSKLNKGINNKMYGRTKEKCPSFGLKRTNDTRKKMSISKIGKNNPNACKYFIQTPDGKEIIVNAASEFIKKYPNYKINRHFIYYQSKKNNKKKKNEWYIRKIIR